MTAAPPGLTFRPPRPDELPECALVWHRAVDGYMARLNRPLLPPALEPLVELMGHLLATDPERFVVAVRPGRLPRQPDRIAGFGIAVQREHVWYLSQLFVLPDEQAHGIGRALLAAVMPGLEPGAANPEPSSDRGGANDANDEDGTRPDGPAPAARAGVMATATDAVQPISNAMYARLGIVPRMPVFNLVGRPSERGSLPRLPDGVRAVPFAIRAGAPGPGDAADGHARLTAAVDSIDRAILGYAHPADHRYLRRSGRLGFLFERGDGEVLGYGYTSEVGRFGPVALLDETLTAPALAHLLTVVEPRGVTSAWVPGANDRAFVALLRAGLRVEGFPGMLCWTRPFASFERYLPGGLALL